MNDLTTEQRLSISTNQVNTSTCRDVRALGQLAQLVVLHRRSRLEALWKGRGSALLLAAGLHAHEAQHRRSQRNGQARSRDDGRARTAAPGRRASSQSLAYKRWSAGKDVTQGGV